MSHATVSTLECPRNRILGDRPRRVMLLLASIIVLSLVDLLITLFHLQTTGMIESNPVVVFLVRTTGSAWALALYKTGTVVVCVMLLYRVRKHVQGEIASWLALMILVGVSFMWHYYMQASDSPENVQLAQILHGDEWLILD
ncbi:MAG: DUF5658 family protein [Planctomycetota bacterium]|nr:DUF5658 family protein [Planctomycetota bacterium]